MEATRTADPRQEVLARVVQSELAQGARVESQTGQSAVLVRGRPVNHILHVILSVLTLGIWLIVWIVISLSGGEKRTMVTVDPGGNVATQTLSTAGSKLPLYIAGGVIGVLFVLWLIGQTA